MSAVDDMDARLKELLAAASAFGADDIGGDTSVEDLGLSSLQVQILLGRIQKVFGIAFQDGDLASIRTYDGLRAVVSRRRSA